MDTTATDDVLGEIMFLPIENLIDSRLVEVGLSIRANFAVGL